VTTLR